jgi:hypothetical protein
MMIIIIYYSLVLCKLYFYQLKYLASSIFFIEGSVVIILSLFMGRGI